MALTPASITGGSPATIGEVDWTDNVDNWRQVDAEWLQSRSVVRIDGATPATSSNLISGSEAKGRVYYTTNKNKVLVNVGTTASPSYETLLSSDSVVLADSVSTVTLGIDGHTAAGLVFTKSSGAVSVGDLTVSGSFSVSDLAATNSFSTKAGSNTSTGLLANSSGVSFDTTNAGGTTNKITFTTSASKLNIDKGVVIAAGGVSITAGGITVTAGGITVSAGPSTISGGLTVNGGLTIGNTGITVTSGATSLQAATATTVTASTSVTTPALAPPSTSDLTINVPTGRNIRFTASSGPNGMDAFYANTAARMAFVVTGSNLTATDYPEGTIWIA